MARAPIGNKLRKLPHKKSTSIGRNAKPTNKHQRRSHKKYRGQGTA